MSDILIASRAEGRATPRRWADLTIAPVVGAIRRNTPVSLVWETYDLGAMDGAAQYTITITLQRERSTAGRIAARIVGTVGGVVGIDRTDDRITMRFDRTVAHAPILVDNIVVALGETPPGSYLLSVQINDRSGNAVTARTTRLVIQ
jgi:hypothetical protein